MKLEKGDIIDIIAPGYGVSKRDLSIISEFISSIGFTPRIPDDLLGDDLLSSNDDKSRFKHLKNALAADDSNAIWCIKGGYGTTRILPMLETISKPKNKKLVLGFSDITALHLFFNQKWGWKTLHAPILWQIVRDKISKNSIDAVTNILKEISIEGIDVESLNNSKTKIKGQIAGGNLKLLQCSIGTNWQVNAKDKILIIEDVDEKPYQVDRMLTHLKQANIFESIKAIIFGSFNDASQESDAQIVPILQRFADETKIPCFKSYQFGHARENLPIIIGGEYKIEYGKLDYIK